jgi:hypothetical protein
MQLSCTAMECMAGGWPAAFYETFHCWLLAYCHGCSSEQGANRVLVVAMGSWAAPGGNQRTTALLASQQMMAAGTIEGGATDPSCSSQPPRW